jgi:CHAT domain-containing protein/Tfp pilus assembly protein PilF
MVIMHTKVRANMSVGIMLLAALIAFALPESIRAPLGCRWMINKGMALDGGVSLERDIVGFQKSFYHFQVLEGYALHVVITQNGVDVAVRVISPSGECVLAIDGPNGPEGPETVAIVAREAGAFVLVVETDETSRGTYILEVLKVGPANRTDEARAKVAALYSQAELLRRAGRIESQRAARRIYRQALEWCQQANEPLLEARIHWRLAKVLSDLGDVTSSMAMFAKAMEFYDQYDNGWEQAPFYNEAGEVFRLAGDPLRARVLFERALQLARQVDADIAVATSFNNLGVLHSSMGDVQEAFVAYERALDTWQHLGNGKREAAVMHNLGILYASLGRFEEANDLLDQALEIRLRQNAPGPRAVTLTGIGWTRALRGDYAGALSAYNEALGLRRAAGDLQGEAVTLELRGTLYLLMGRQKDALDACLQALRRVEGQGHLLNEAYIRTNIGIALVNLERPKEAGAYLESARKYFVEVGDLDGQALVLESLARAERQMGHLDLALQHLEAARDRVEAVRSQLRSQAFRRSYLAVRHDVYEAYIDLLMYLEEEEGGRGYAERAFEAAEQVRARSLLENLRASEGMPLTFSQRESLRVLKMRINEYDRRRLRLADEEPSKVATLGRELRSLLLEYEALRGEIRTTGIHHLSEPEALSLEEIRREVLDKDTVLLVYGLGDKRSFLWIIGSESFEYRVLGPRRRLETLAREVHGLIQKSHHRGYGLQTALAVRELRNAILPPHLEASRLLVVPDGALHYVPFSMLPDPGSRGVHRSLLSTHEIIYLPSASVLVQLRRALVDRRQASGLLAVIADPVLRRDDPRLGARMSPRASVGRGVLGGADSRFDRLLYTGREATTLLSLAKHGRNLKAEGFEASRELVLSGKLGNYRLVHFATHSLIRDDYPALSGIVLSQFDVTGRPQEGVLRLHEIYDLSLTAELVVLAACQTALGREIKGEGLVGLNHGFFTAGAARLVVSLWDVDDRATAEFMGRFYKNLLDHDLPPSRALRSAQLSMIQDDLWSAPYYWAGFALQGEWR